MLVITDQSTELASNNDYTVVKYGNITLEDYIEIHNDKRDDIIVYCLGYNDLKKRMTTEQLLSLYHSLKRGKLLTGIVLPKQLCIDDGEELEFLSDDNIIVMYELICRTNLEEALIELKSKANN